MDDIAGRPAPVGTFSNGRYAAFISYSHADEEICDWLHKRLENYRTPSPLVGRPRPAGVVGKRLGKFFRDRVELSAAHDLGAEIRRALDQADALIVLCSPRACRSTYVNEEIRYFKALGKSKNVFAAIVDGEPHAAGKPGYAASDECFPPALLHRLDDRGALTTQPELNEPIAADFRQGKDGRENGSLKLIAGLLDVGLDELVQRERQAERGRRLRANAIAASMAILALGAAVAGAVALQQRNAAKLNEDLAMSQRARAERGERTAVENANIANAERDRADGNAAIAEQRRQAAEDERARATAALAEVLMSRSREEGATSNYGLQLMVAASHLDPRNLSGAIDGLRERVRQAPSLRVTLPHPRPVRIAAFATNGASVALGDEAGGVTVYDAWRGRPRGSGIDLGGEIMALEAHENGAGHSFAAASIDGSLALVSAGSHEPVVRRTDHHESLILSLKVESISGSIITAGLDAARIWDGRTLEPITPFLRHERAGQVLYADFLDRDTAVTAGADGAIRTWNAASGEPISVLRAHASRIVAGAKDPWGGVVTADADRVVRHTNASTGESRVLATLSADVTGISTSSAGAVVAMRGGSVRVFPFPTEETGSPIVIGPGVRSANFLSNAHDTWVAASIISERSADVAVLDIGRLYDVGNGTRSLSPWLTLRDVGHGYGVYNQRIAYTNAGHLIAVIDHPAAVRIFHMGEAFGGDRVAEVRSSIDALGGEALRARACALLPVNSRNIPEQALRGDAALSAIASALPRNICPVA